MLRQSTIFKYWDTVWCIAASKHVQEFMIGYTRRPLRFRQGEYQRKHGYQYSVVLANGLTKDEAHQLEESIQHLIKSDKRLNIYRKYNPERRDGRYYPSEGPTSQQQLDPLHSVYMAWWCDE